MPDTSPDAFAKTLGETGKDIGPFISTRLREVMQLAMQLSATERGVPRRCRKKSCQRSGCCSMTIDKAGDGHCGGGIDRATMRQAAVMLQFLGRLGNTWFRGC